MESGLVLVIDKVRLSGELVWAFGRRPEDVPSGAVANAIIDNFASLPPDERREIFERAEDVLIARGESPEAFFQQFRHFVRRRADALRGWGEYASVFNQLEKDIGFKVHGEPAHSRFRAHRDHLDAEAIKAARTLSGSELYSFLRAKPVEEQAALSFIVQSRDDREPGLAKIVYAWLEFAEARSLIARLERMNIHYSPKEDETEFGKEIFRITIDGLTPLARAFLQYCIAKAVLNHPGTESIGYHYDKGMLIKGVVHEKDARISSDVIVTLDNLKMFQQLDVAIR